MNKKGFSLIEVMVAMAILAVLVGIAVPNYLNWNARYAFRGAANDLASNLKLSKLSAMSRNTSVTLTLQNNGGKTEYSVQDTLLNTVIPTETLPPDLTVAGGLPVSVTFNPFGQKTPAGTGNQIINLDSANNPNTRYVITVTESGKVRVQMINI